MLAAVLIAVALLSLLAPPAKATFPGRDGDLIVTEHVRTHGPFGSSTLLRIDPGSGAITRTPVCAQGASPPLPQPECGDTGPPSASPDGASVAFAAADVIPGPPYSTPPTFSLRVVSLATGDWRQVPLPGRTLPFESLVRWTPDLSFVLEAGGHRVLLAGPDGSDRGRLVSHASAPDVSSGGRLAFIRRRNVYVLKPNGATRRLTGKSGDQPSWSPHGKSIAFARKGWVWSIRAQGGRARRLTRGFNPVWSPDGEQIAFFRAVPSALNFGREVTFLYVLDRRAGHARRVTSEWYIFEDDIPPDGLDWQVAR